MSLHYTVAEEVFERFPEYVRGVVTARGITNGPSPAELVQLLRRSEASFRGSIAPSGLSEEPRLAAWREAFRRVGVRPSEFHPSIEALGRRVVRGQELPSINRLVDIGNVLSLLHLVPVGGHAVDLLVEGVALRPATGEEAFHPIGSDRQENPARGEYILSDGGEVLARRWIWRQGQHSMLTADTTALIVNVDCLPPLDAGDAVRICEELRELVERFCGGGSTINLLSHRNRSFDLDHFLLSSS